MDWPGLASVHLLLGRGKEEQRSVVYSGTFRLGCEWDEAAKPPIPLHPRA